MIGPRDRLLSIIELAKGRLRLSSLEPTVERDLAEIVKLARLAIVELPASVPPAPPNVDAQLEAAARSDADEVLRPRHLVPRIERVQRREGREEHDTDPAMPALAEGDGVLAPYEQTR